MLTMTYEEWAEVFRPLDNHFEGNGQQVFETYGEQLEFVRGLIDEHRVWTLSDGDDGGTYISDGYSFVNRIGYLVTEKPYDPDVRYSVLDTEPSECDHDWTSDYVVITCALCGEEKEEEE